MKLILASSSPRRSKLLSEAGIQFDIKPSDEIELLYRSQSPAENAERIALMKACSVAARYRDALVLAADTIVVIEETILGKPEDKEEALHMLSKLAGHEHEVITGVAFVHMEKDLKWSTTESSKVRFAKIPEKELLDYISGGEPMDKAGGYAIQGGAAKWIDGYTGSISNIIGLPMERVIETFNRFGYKFPKENASCR